MTTIPEGWPTDEMIREFIAMSSGYHDVPKGSYLWGITELGLKASLAAAPPTVSDMQAFGASDAACYKWPGDTPEHKALRAAYIAGAADVFPAAAPAPPGDARAAKIPEPFLPAWLEDATEQLNWTAKALEELAKQLGVMNDYFYPLIGAVQVLQQDDSQAEQLTSLRATNARMREALEKAIIAIGDAGQYLASLGQDTSALEDVSRSASAAVATTAPT